MVSSVMAEDDACDHPNTPREAQETEGKRDTVGNYTLGKKLGRGSFCKVRLATHNSTGIKYGMKILKPSARKSSFDDLEREIRVLSGLRHPHIIGLHDILYQDHTGKIMVGGPNSSLQHVKKLYLVVDLASNGELFEYILSKKKISEEESRWMFRQIISAVEYLHAHCVAHRDLKPENILLDTQNTIKLNDFGLSNFVQPEKRMNTFCGSPVYAAPEVMRKSYYDGVVADVWSLGVILFTMVTGCLPWKLNIQTNRIENIDDMFEGRYYVPNCVSPECASLLSKMLVPDPTKRAHLNEVRKHPWVNDGYMDYPPRYLEPQMPVTEIDKVVLKQMQSMGFMQNRVCQDVFGNKNKPSVTIYHTLLKRRNLLLLLNSTPASKQSEMIPARRPSATATVTNPRFKAVYSPMDPVPEGELSDFTPLVIALPPSPCSSSSPPYSPCSTPSSLSSSWPSTPSSPTLTPSSPTLTPSSPTTRRRPTLSVLITGSPKLGQAGVSPRGGVSPVAGARSPGTPPARAWKPLEMVEEEPPAVAAAPPPIALPKTGSSLSRWIKELTSVKLASDLDFREDRVAVPTLHGISNFLKRRHSVPETQHELRNLNNTQEKTVREPKPGSILHKIISRVRRSSGVSVGASG